MSGSILNEELKWSDVSADVRSKFVGGQATRRLFRAWSDEFYKLSSWSLFKPDGTVTPWWSSVQPIDGGDPGLQGTLERAERMGVSAAPFVRARAAVTSQASGGNDLTGVLRMKLRVSAYGFFGRCSGQPYSDEPGYSNVLWIGGAYQIWIPNLTSREAAQVSR